MSYEYKTVNYPLTPEEAVRLLDKGISRDFQEKPKKEDLVAGKGVLAEEAAKVFELFLNQQ